ncbi:hypothetical protein V8C86DRAFT_3132679 [Haematococcus lacustris]
MPPRAVPLAYAGRKLTGPPEGYDKKKELQVKRWLLTGTRQPSEEVSEVAMSMASISELGGQLDPALDDLYKDLRDSTDGDLLPFHKVQDAPVTAPPKQAPRPVLPVTATGMTTMAPAPDIAARLTSPAFPIPVPALGSRATYSGLSIPIDTTTSFTGPSKGPSVGSQALPASPPLPAPSARSSQALGGSPLPSPLSHGPSSPGGGLLSQSCSSTNGPTTPVSPQAGQLAALSPSPTSQPSRRKEAATAAATAAAAAAALPLDVVLEGLRPALVARVLGPPGPGPGQDGQQQAVAVAVGLLLARVEAVMEGVAGSQEQDKYKVALLMAVQEKQRLAEEVRRELAAARAASLAAQQAAEQRVSGAAADLAAAAERAKAAESELGRCRAQLARQQQELKAQRMEVEDAAEEHRAEVARLQAQVAAALERLQSQGDAREAALRAAHEDSRAARETAVALDRQLRSLRQQTDLEAARLNMEVVTLRRELQAAATDMAKVLGERQAALDSWQAEAAARIAAEESEKRALQAAAKQASVGSSLAEAQQVSGAVRAQAALAAQRSAALRAPDPVSGLAAAAAVGAKGGRQRGRPGTAPPGGVAAAVPGSPGSGPSPASPAASASPPQPACASPLASPKARAAREAGRGGGAKAWASTGGGSPNAVQRQGASSGGTGLGSGRVGGGPGGEGGEPRPSLRLLKPAGGGGELRGRPALHQEFEAVELVRHDAHRTLARHLAADKALLGDVLRQQPGVTAVAVSRGGQRSSGKAGRQQQQQQQQLAPGGPRPTADNASRGRGGKVAPPQAEPPPLHTGAAGAVMPPSLSTLHALFSLPGRASAAPAASSAALPALLAQAARRAVLAAQLADSRAVEQALASAPEHLRALGLAFRAFLVAAPSQLQPPSGQAAALAAALGAAGYRAFIDPCLLNMALPAVPGLQGVDLAPSCPLVAAAGCLLLLASPGLMALPLPAAALEESSTRGVPLLMLALPDLTLEQVLGPTPAAAAAQGAQPTQPTSPPSQPVSAAPGTGDVPVLSSKAQAWLHSAWEERLTLQPGPGAAEAVLPALCDRLGLTDSELQALPLDTLKKLSVERLLAWPDLRTLANAPRLTHLKLTLQPPPAAAGGSAAQRAAGGPGPPAGAPTSPAANRGQGWKAGRQAGAAAAAGSESVSLAAGGVGGGGGGVALGSLLRILAANTSLTALTLKGKQGGQGGASVGQASQVARAVAASSGCRVRSITQGCEVPVAGLVGQQGVPPLTLLDLAQAEAGWTPQDAAVLEAALAWPGAAAATSLTRLALPPALNPAWDNAEGQAVASSLAATIASCLRGLTHLNGAPLAACSRPPRPLAPPATQAAQPAPAPGTASTAAPAPDAVLDLGGHALGPVALAALLQLAGAAQRLGPALRLINLTGCGAGVGGAAALASRAGAAGGLPGLEVACLADNRLGPEGLAEVWRCLGRPPAPGPAAAALTAGGAAAAAACLAALDLSLNQLGDAGAQLLSRCLASLPALTALSLGHNNIQVSPPHSGASALAPPPRPWLRPPSRPPASPPDPGLTAPHAPHPLLTPPFSPLPPPPKPPLLSLPTPHYQLPGQQDRPGLPGGAGPLILPLLPGGHESQGPRQGRGSSRLLGCGALASGRGCRALLQAEGARCLAATLPGLTKLQDLQLPGNFLGDGGVAALAAAAAKLPALTRLHLQAGQAGGQGWEGQENYNIGVEGGRALGGLLAASSSLKELQLAKNHLGSEGARQLALGLASSTSLTALDLEWCKLRCEGVAHIGAALAGQPSLQVLNLARNGAGDKGVKAVAEGLERNCSLLHLDLRGNGCGLLGCRLLSGALRERNTRLQALLMAGNEVPEPTLKALEDLARSTRTPPSRRPLDFQPPGPPAATAPSSAAPSSAALATAPRRPLATHSAGDRSVAAAPSAAAARAAGTIQPAHLLAQLSRQPRVSLRSSSGGGSSLPGPANRSSGGLRRTDSAATRRSGPAASSQEAGLTGSRAPSAAQEGSPPGRGEAGRVSRDWEQGGAVSAAPEAEAVGRRESGGSAGSSGSDLSELLARYRQPAAAAVVGGGAGSTSPSAFLRYDYTGIGGRQQLAAAEEVLAPPRSTATTLAAPLPAQPGPRWGCSPALARWTEGGQQLQRSAWSLVSSVTVAAGLGLRGGAC